MILCGARQLALSLLFAGSLAALLTLVGTRDLESYEHAFFSLDRGTAATGVRAFGHPVFTLALGLGVRLPLHGSLGASPAALAGPLLPAPLVYWLLLTIAITAALTVVRRALDPLCGRVTSWLAVMLLFCSVPMVSYTVYNDWPETAVTYCAVVASVFAPHALLTSLSPHRPGARLVGSISVAGALWGLVGLAHPGAWPLIAVSLVLSSFLTLWRSNYALGRRVTAVAVLAVVALTATGLQLPDIWRELQVAGEEVGVRDGEGPTGSLIRANLFPFEPLDNRGPFTFLLMALMSLAAGLRYADGASRRLLTGSALVSIGLGLGATMLYPGSSSFAPSSSWALRDPAGVFAILGAATAAGSIRASSTTRRLIARRLLAALLVLGGLQGVAYAVTLAGSAIRASRYESPWNRDLTAPASRVSLRGFPIDRLPRGGRLALWPGVRAGMRTAGRASTDFADAGYPVVTAWTKQRTMQGLVEPNPYLFDQTTDLSSEVLCDPAAVRFLHLHYLLVPSEIECPPWVLLPDIRVDGWLHVAVASDADARVRALPLARSSEPLTREPALSAGAALLTALVPVDESTLTLEPNTIRVELVHAASASDVLLVLPVAFDEAWQSSSGRVHNTGGFLALADVRERRATVLFRPDAALRLRAMAMTLAQVLTVLGTLGLSYACART